LKLIKLTVFIIWALCITQAQAYTALPTSLDLISSTTNSSTGNYRLSWTGGHIGLPPPPSTFSLNSASQKSSLLAPSSKGLVTFSNFLFENGRKIATVPDFGGLSLSGKSSGTYDYYINSCTTSLNCINSNHVIVTVTQLNNVPTITNISDKTINEDSNTGNVAFSIGDIETSTNSLSLSRNSSNTALVPTDNIVFGGSGANRTVRVTPVANKYGSSRITVTVSDGNKTRSDTFVVKVNSVNDTPTISNISNKTINEDSNTGNVFFSIGDVETQASLLSLSRTSSNTALVPTGNIVFGGSGAIHTVRVTPVANKYGSSTITVTVSDGNKTKSDTFVVKVNPVNDTPTISYIPNKTFNEDSNTGNVAFSVGDVETSTSSLTLSRTSSNTVLVPTGNIVFGGSGANRTVRVTPVANKYGSSTITVTVSDGNKTKSDTFVVKVNSVNDTPTISNIANKTINEDSNTGNVAFSIGDIETSTNSLLISRKSSNTALVPTGNIVLGGSGANRTVRVIPVANKYGSATITVTVSDGNKTKSDTFVVKVNSVNDTPTITNITNKTINEDSNTGNIAFTISDLETSTSSLSISRKSSNTALVPTGNIVLGGSGANRTVRVTPVANKYGSATITVTVSDGNKAKNDTFVVKVNPVNDIPTITNITNKTINEDSNTGNIAFTIGDIETSTSSLSLSRTSSNTALVPTGNIVLGGSGANRTVRVTPVANKYGSATITVTVSDGNKTKSDTFVVKVNSKNDAPVIVQGTSTSLAVLEDTSKGLSLSAIDIDSSILTWSMHSNPSHGHTLMLSRGNSKTLTYRPVPNYNGSDSFKVRVSDGALTDVITVNVSVAGVNDTPTISNISNKTIDEDNHTGNIPFVIGDMETSTNSLYLSKTSSNTVLIPTGNIVFGGSGANRTVRVTPAADKFGSSTITVKVSDGNKTRNESFIVNVTSVIDLPTFSEISRQVIDEDESTNTLSFKIIGGDIEHFIWVSGSKEEGNMLFAQTSATVTSTSSSTRPYMYFDIKPDTNSVNSLSNRDWLVKVTPEADWFGEVLLTLTAIETGKYGEKKVLGKSNFSLAVNPVNDAPIISGEPDKEAFFNRLYSFTPDAVDIDSRTLSFSITNKPSWANFDTTTGELSGIPTEGDEVVCLSKPIVISVTDGEFVIPLPTFKIEVLRKRRVISFIHTDILGTPAAETDIDGELL
jgi:hemin uptake protein HemP